METKEDLYARGLWPTLFQKKRKEKKLRKILALNFWAICVSFCEPSSAAVKVKIFLLFYFCNFLFYFCNLLVLYLLGSNASNFFDAKDHLYFKGKKNKSKFHCKGFLPQANKCLET
jgi:hypothetical protein